MFCFIKKHQENERRFSVNPFRPSYINVVTYAKHRDCFNIIQEHPWLKDLKMYENIYLTNQLTNVDYEKNTIELSTEVMQQPLDFQREIFINSVCHLLAQHIFHDTSYGNAYQLLVKRYMPKVISQEHTEKDLLYNH